MLRFPKREPFLVGLVLKKTGRPMGKDDKCGGHEGWEMGWAWDGMGGPSLLFGYVMICWHKMA
jgi:hypothetical protein